MHEALYKLIVEQQRLAVALGDNIRAIATSISETPADALDGLLVENGALLRQLDAGTKALQSDLAQRGLDATSIGSAINQLDNASDLSREWQHFCKAIENCKVDNNASAMLVRGCLKHTQQTLKILTGQGLEVQPGYSNDGSPDTEQASRKLAKA
ncbi:MAG: flagellar export chaperone FlgN [Pseudomonadota bacterium]